MNPTKTHRTFNGNTQFWQHDSHSTKTVMKFSTFVPDAKPKGAIIWLSGLTCTEENFITKAGAQKYLAEEQWMVICPDTSPRGLNLPHEHDSIYFGSAASYYVDATTEGYRDHYLMERYITEEIYHLLQTQFHIGKNCIAIAGHSMGGHGALTLGLRHPDKFKSISAFAPISNPTQSKNGQHALNGYLGADTELHKQHDATCLIQSGHKHAQTILIDQGSDDESLYTSLLTQHFVDACKKHNQSCVYNLREGYDHSYYFVSTFMQSHIQFHARM